MASWSNVDEIEIKRLKARLAEVERDLASETRQHGETANGYFEARARVSALEAALQDIAECWPDTPAGEHAEAALAALDRAGSAEGGK